MIKDKNTALIVIDVQNDFCPGGALAVAEGDQVIAPINALSAQFSNVVFTQDWHPSDHISFASNHANKSPFELISLDYGEQTLWPNHCVGGSDGAKLHATLDTTKAQTIIRKGFRSNMDSYSAFFENDHQTATGLAGYLQQRGINDLFLCGLATDYCVAWSAIDAVKLGFRTSVILSACRAIDLDGSLQRQMQLMQQSGVNFIE